MNEAMSAGMTEVPAEARLDERVGRIRAIDRELNELRKERDEIGEEVNKLREAMIRKVEDAGAVVGGEYPKTERTPPGRL